MNCVMNCGTDFKEQFVLDNAQRKHKLKVTLVNCKPSSMPILGYYATIKKIWDEFINRKQLADYIHVVC